jgi:hypothetical protein
MITLAFIREDYILESPRADSATEDEDEEEGKITPKIDNYRVDSATENEDDEKIYPKKKPYCEEENVAEQHEKKRAKTEEENQPALQGLFVSGVSRPSTSSIFGHRSGLSSSTLFGVPIQMPLDSVVDRVPFGTPLRDTIQKENLLDKKPADTRKAQSRSCEYCQKVYSSRQSLHAHKKKCKSLL